MRHVIYLTKGVAGMATVGVIGPIHHEDHLAPGKSAFVQFPVSEGFKNCALSVSASPHAGIGGKRHVLTVDAVHLVSTDIGPPNVGQVHEASAGCSVTNVGKTEITEWSVLVGVIVP
jgi:hypothetical protein